MQVSRSPTSASNQLKYHGTGAGKTCDHPAKWCNFNERAGSLGKAKSTIHEITRNCTKKAHLVTLRVPSWIVRCHRSKERQMNYYLILFGMRGGDQSTLRPKKV